MKKDHYSLVDPTGRYLVRSLYFDTDDFQNYQEKMNGNCDRVKLRLRTYSTEISNDLKLRVEFKVRRGVLTEKYVTWVDYLAYREFMENGHWKDVSNTVLAEFERLCDVKAWRPKVLIEYRREGFVTRSKGDLRLTFDHKVKSTQACSLFPQNLFFRNHYPGWVILEIKCSQKQPAWLTGLVQQNGLHIVPNSKYTQSIEIARPEVVMEAWSD
jgi:SPX domain protein involved in polyphosphate accumulation